MFKLNLAVVLVVALAFGAGLVVGVTYRAVRPSSPPPLSDVERTNQRLDAHEARIRSLELQFAHDTLERNFIRGHLPPDSPDKDR
jgi:hypothetical protein